MKMAAKEAHEQMRLKAFAENKKKFVKTFRGLRLITDEKGNRVWV